MKSILESHKHSSKAFKPELFKLSVEADRVRFEQIALADPRLEVYDTFFDQMVDLLDSRDPARKQTPEERAQALKEHMGTTPEAVGTWVYYPWSHRLVHVLAEHDFAELRTDRNRYKITPDEQEVLAAQRIGIVGLSLGHSVALTLAMERCCGELRLADFDRVSLSNLNRLRGGVHELGALKSHSTARAISELDPYLRVACFPAGLTDQNLDEFLLEGGRLDLLIDACDDLAMKLLLRKHARELGIPVLMESSERGMVDVERFDLEPDRPILQDMLEDVDPEQLRSLSNAEKVPFLMRLFGEENLSGRMIASLMEVGHSIETWPQLASAATLGAGLAADTARRILLGQLRFSGRFHVDLEQIIGGEPASSAAVPSSRLSSATSQSPAAEATASATEGVGFREKIQAIVEAGIRAPSGGNCQPWRWTATGRSLFLFHDRERSASLLDYQDTAAHVALGAAVENAILEAHHQGLEVRLTPFPNKADSTCAAQLDLLDKASPDTECHDFDSLIPALLQRCTNRKLGPRRQPTPEQMARIAEAAESISGARLQLLTSDEQLREVGAILGTGDRVRFFDPRLHAEMMSEVRWTPQEVQQTQDGIDLETLELSPTDRAGIQLCRSWSAMQVLSRIGGGVGLEKLSRKAVASSFAVGLLTMPSASREDFFQGGRALERAWLSATAEGIALQPVTSLIYLFARLVRGDGDGLPAVQIQELRKLRARYEKLFVLFPEDGEILLFRLALADAATIRALRRPAPAVLSFKAS